LSLPPLILGAIFSGVVTPTEAAVLAGRPVRTVADMRAAAEAIRAAGARAVLLKGGHLEGGRITDLLLTEAGEETFVDDRIDSRHTHGTGCTLASAIATGIAQGLSLRDAVARGRAYVRAAIASAPGYGHGHGPLDHAHTVGAFPVP
jgi:hydroxymethylpyrimidine/phosphomethylpyrimidine kinase